MKNQDKIIKKYEELTELLFQFHDLYRNGKKINTSYEQWRGKVVTLQLEIDMLKNKI
jgi:hypothetical protein